VSDVRATISPADRCIMSPPLHHPILRVADLVDRPGASRRVHLELSVPDDFEVPLADLRDPVRIDGVLESVVDGILLRGTLSVDATLSCARCLVDVATTLQVEVVELFRDPATVAPDDEPVEEGYELLDGTVSVDGLLRDALAPSLPFQPLCDEHCAGLCALCGANRNEVDCGCTETIPDGRWAALEGLRLQDGPPAGAPPDRN
jgi:uncharacterized protein